MKTKNLKRKLKARPGGSLKPVGSEPECEDCGMPLTNGSGLADRFPDGRMVVMLWCPNCGTKRWSKPFIPNDEDEP
jgi:RNase P subunit RPR2